MARNPLEYVGVGFDAFSVGIVAAETTMMPFDTLLLEAVALDSLGQPIDSTPIFWLSLDSTLVRVPDAGVGRVVSAGTLGVVGIVAGLLTGPADTGLIAIR